MLHCAILNCPLKWIRADNPSPQIVRSSLAGILTDAVNIGTELIKKIKRFNIIARGDVADNFLQWIAQIRISAWCTHTHNPTSTHTFICTYTHIHIHTQTNIHTHLSLVEEYSNRSICPALPSGSTLNISASNTCFKPYQINNCEFIVIKIKIYQTKYLVYRVLLTAKKSWSTSFKKWWRWGGT